MCSSFASTISLKKESSPRMGGNFCLKARAENDGRLKSLKAGGTLVNGDSSTTSRISQDMSGKFFHRKTKTPCWIATEIFEDFLEDSRLARCWGRHSRRHCRPLLGCCEQEWRHLLMGLGEWNLPEGQPSIGSMGWSTLEFQNVGLQRMGRRKIGRSR